MALARICAGGGRNAHPYREQNRPGADSLAASLSDKRYLQVRRAIVFPVEAAAVNVAGAPEKPAPGEVHAATRPLPIYFLKSSCLFDQIAYRSAI